MRHRSGRLRHHQCASRFSVRLDSRVTRGARHTRRGRRPLCDNPEIFGAGVRRTRRERPFHQPNWEWPFNNLHSKSNWRGAESHRQFDTYSPFNHRETEMIAFAPFARHFLHSLFLCLVYFVVHKISELKTDNSLATPKQLVSPKFDEGGSEGGKIKTAEARSAFAELVFKQRPRPALASH